MSSIMQTVCENYKEQEWVDLQEKTSLKQHKYLVGCNMRALISSLTSFDLYVAAIYAKEKADTRALDAEPKTDIAEKLENCLKEKKNAKQLLALVELRIKTLEGNLLNKKVEFQKRVVVAHVEAVEDFKSSVELRTTLFMRELSQ